MLDILQHFKMENWFVNHNRLLLNKEQLYKLKICSIIVNKENEV